MAEIDWETAAKRLWQLLDDIDTLGDALKPEQSRYFSAVETLHRKRHQVLKTDGYSLSAPIEQDAEQRGYSRGLADGAAPFEALMSFYDEGQRVELYVGEGGSRYAESPSAYGFGDDARRAALALCRTLGIETPGESE